MQWDAKLRERVWALYPGGLLIAVVAALIWRLSRKLSIEDFVASCLVPILPAMVQFWRKLQAHRSAAPESEKSKDHINRLWTRVTKAELNDAELTTEARRTQDGLYERRRRGPQIPDVVYQWKRAAFEKQMKTGRRRDGHRGSAASGPRAEHVTPLLPQSPRKSPLPALGNAASI